MSFLDRLNEALRTALESVEECVTSGAIAMAPVTAVGYRNTSKLPKRKKRKKKMNEQRGRMLDSRLKSKINHQLAELVSGVYFDSPPLGEMFGILKDYGIVPVQEDNTKWEGFLAGSEGNAGIDIAPIDSGKGVEGETMFTPYTNSVLFLTWHKMEETGRYEIVAYLS